MATSTTPPPTSSDSAAALVDDVVTSPAKRSATKKFASHVRRSRVVRRFSKKKFAIVALVFLALLLLVAIFHKLLEPYDPNVQDLNASLQGPGSAHLLGTDLYGRDTLSRLIAATPVTLQAAAEGLGIAVLIGVPVGLAAGFLGGAFDAIVSRVADAFLSLPPIILALALIAVLGRGLTNAMVAVGIVLAPRFFRVARGAAQSIATEGYAEAARADGVSSWRLLWRHVLPNANGPLLVQISFGVGAIITTEAALSYLGLGVQSPQSSWGSMLRDAFQNVRQESFPLVPPAVLVTLTIMAFFLLGDGLRDSLGRDAS
jgi:peptide/nickel transport system permease protein